MIRITQHPKNPDFLLLKVPHDLNSRMGSYGPAQLAPDLGGYVMAAADIDSFASWARYQNIQVLNEVRSQGERTQPVECGNTVDDGTTCCAPYRASQIPEFCGACGQPAKPVVFHQGEPLIGVKCPTCERLNHGGPRFCTACGTTLPDHHLRAPAIGRTRGEPVALGDAIAELRKTRNA